MRHKIRRRMENNNYKNRTESVEIHKSREEMQTEANDNIDRKLEKTFHTAIGRKRKR